MAKNWTLSEKKIENFVDNKNKWGHRKTFRDLVEQMNGNFKKGATIDDMMLTKHHVCWTKNRKLVKEFMEVGMQLKVIQTFKHKGIRHYKLINAHLK